MVLEQTQSTQQAEPPPEFAFFPPCDVHFSLRSAPPHAIYSPGCVHGVRVIAYPRRVPSICPDGRMNYQNAQSHSRDFRSPHANGHIEYLEE